MKAGDFYIVLYNKDNVELHRSKPSKEYPKEDHIEFGLGYKDVTHVRVEREYTN